MYVTYNIVRLENEEMMLGMDAERKVAERWLNHYRKRAHLTEGTFILVCSENGTEYRPVN